LTTEAVIYLHQARKEAEAVFQSHACHFASRVNHTALLLATQKCNQLSNNLWYLPYYQARRQDVAAGGAKNQKGGPHF